MKNTYMLFILIVAFECVESRRNSNAVTMKARARGIITDAHSADKMIQKQNKIISSDIIIFHLR